MRGGTPPDLPTDHDSIIDPLSQLPSRRLARARPGSRLARYAVSRPSPPTARLLQERQPATRGKPRLPLCRHLPRPTSPRAGQWNQSDCCDYTRIRPQIVAQTSALWTTHPGVLGLSGSGVAGPPPAQRALNAPDQACVWRLTRTEGREEHSSDTQTVRAKDVGEHLIADGAG